MAVNLVGAKTFVDSILSDILTAVTGTLIGATMELFTSNTNPTEDSVAADFTMALFTGHAAKTVTWLAPDVADDGSIEVMGTVPEFRPSDGVVPEMVYGAVMLNGAAVFLGACRFGSGPLPMESDLDNIILTPRVRISAGGLVEVIS